MMKSVDVPALISLWGVVGLLLPGGAQAQMMGGSMASGMMWLMVAFCLLITAVLVLAIAALVKYLFRK